jgi:7-keto-8-aminopelargonate synthetase-like enzyme
VAAGLVPDPDRLAAAITPRSRAIVTVSPNNPSGLVTPPEVLAAWQRAAEEVGATAGRGLYREAVEATDLECREDFAGAERAVGVHGKAEDVGATAVDVQGRVAGRA